MNKKKPMTAKFIAMGLFLSLYSLQSFGGGKIAGNGGGAVVRNGAVITFGSARMPVQPIADIVVPGMPEAEKGIEALHVPSSIQQNLFLGLRVSSQRKYFWINRSDIDSKTYAKLMSIYSDIGNKIGIASGDKVTLVALTSGTETYLIKGQYGFDQLPDADSQAAILFHEALRVTEPGLQTLNVVQLETAFESFIRGTDDVGIYSEIAKNFKPYDDTMVIQAYVDHDLKIGALTDLLDKNSDPKAAYPSIALNALYSGKFDGTSEEMTKLNELEEESYFLPALLSIDKVQWYHDLLSLQLTHPKSLFIQFLMQNINSSFFYYESSAACSEVNLTFASTEKNLSLNIAESAPQTIISGDSTGSDPLLLKNLILPGRLMLGNSIDEGVEPGGLKHCTVQITLMLPGLSQSAALGYLLN